MRAHRFVKGRHSKKTHAFAKACLAYCYISIASMENAFKRLELLLLCAQVAMLNHCLPQTDAYVPVPVPLLLLLLRLLH